MKGVKCFANILIVACVAITQVHAVSQKTANGDAKTGMEEKWFEQYLDHFNVWDNRTFAMRFFENNEFFKPGGPLLLEIGAEAAVDPGLLKQSPSYALAKQLKGKVVLLEHRYYGKSSPFENLTTENLMYLSVEQALEDLAYFVASYKMSTPAMKQSKVAVFGCSYAAALATWFRYKFPHLVDAAWASSGPLRITLDFYEYYEVAGEIYSNVSSECIAIIRQGYREAKQMLSTPEGENETKAFFENWECGNVTEMTTDNILAIIRMVVSDQYGPPNHAVESCKFLQSKNATTTCFQQLAAFVLSKAGDVCFDEDPNDEIAWLYQTCTEFGYSFTTTSHSQPFKDSYSSIDMDVQTCTQDFGEQFNMDVLQRSIDRMNRVYGSTELKVTRVLTVHGTHDPWHKVGLYYETTAEAPVLLIPGTSHCADMSQDLDKPEPARLKQAKKRGMDIIERWLK